MLKLLFIEHVSKYTSKYYKIVLFCRFLPKKKYEEVPIKEILSEKNSKNEKA